MHDNADWKDSPCVIVGKPPSFTLTQTIMEIVEAGGQYVEAHIENECAHALRIAWQAGLNAR